MAKHDEIYIRDTRTGVAALMPSKMLKHAHWSKFFEEVRNDKPVIEQMQKPREARVVEPVIETPKAEPVADEPKKSIFKKEN